MRTVFFLCLMTLSAAAQAQSSTGSAADLLLQQTGDQGPDIQVTAPVAMKKVYLDDPFLVSLYGAWKAKPQLSYETQSWLELIFAKQFEAAAHLIHRIKSTTASDFLIFVEAAEVYLYWQLAIPQTFFNAWLNLATEKKFLTHPMSVALDEVVGAKASSWFLEQGIQISPDQQIKVASLLKQSATTSKLLLSLRAWVSLRQGEGALEVLTQLPESDPLRFYLIQTVVLDQARAGKMKFAAQFLKKGLEPIVSKSKDLEEVVKYHLLLARLLYQAGALEAAAHYYSLIPDRSRFFLQSRVERLWVYLRQGNMPQIKGDLTSLDLDLFAEQFLPEVYLNSSIAHLKLCQFKEVKAAFDAFIVTQKKWHGIIELNRTAAEPQVIDEADPYLKIVQSALNAQIAEIKQLDRLSAASVEAIVPSVGIQPHWSKAKSSLERTAQLTQKVRVVELKKRWENRRRIQDDAIRKMRFVKVELLSLVNQLARASDQGQLTDQVTTYAAAAKKNNQLEFPHDGLTWGDEVFEMTAQVKNLCQLRQQ